MLERLSTGSGTYSRDQMSLDVLCNPALAGKNSQSHLRVTPSMLLRVAISKPCSLAPLTLGSTHSKWASRLRKTLAITLSSVISQTHRQAVDLVLGQPRSTPEALTRSQISGYPQDLHELEDLGTVTQVAKPDSSKQLECSLLDCSEYT